MVKHRAHVRDRGYFSNNHRAHLHDRGYFSNYHDTGSNTRKVAADISKFFRGLIFVLVLSITKITKLKPHENYPLYGIYLAEHVTNVISAMIVIMNNKK